MDFSLSDDQLSFQDAIRRWVDKEAPKAWARELERDEHHYPFALWDKFSEAGFHGVGISEEYGGQGGDVVMQMILGRELARSLAGLAWIWGITSFAGSKSIGVYGSEAQKQKFLPQIAAGRLRAAISFTEPGGGTDVLGALRTEATRGDGGWILNGEKIWSSSAHVADYLLVLARTDKSVEKRHQGVSLFWVPATSPGISITPLPKLGMRSMGSCAVYYQNVFVPDDLVLGEPGLAWYMLLPTLNNERIMVGAFCMGVLDGVIEDALDYMKQRKAFGKIIGEFQVLQHYLADMVIAQQTGTLMLHYAADLQSKGKPCHKESSMLKVMASDAAVKAADRGIQILGGMGYSAETDMQRYWRDARLWQIGPITNEMARNGIAESMGLPRSFSTMKALILTTADGPDSTEVRDMDSTPPGAGQVCVAVRSAALNHRELWITRGQYPGMQLPAVLGCDGAGVVESVGAGVDGALIGTEVILYPGLNWGTDERLPGRDFALLGMPGPGTIAECITVPAQNVVPKPHHLNFDEAAAAPLASLTAWRGLVTKARLAKGEKLLITGVGGGVALAALSLGVALGAIVFVTSSADSTLERAKSLGAREGFNYTDPNWRKAVVAATRGIDVVFDGAPSSSVGNYVRALNPGARVVIYGSTGGAQFTLNAPDLFLRNIEIIGTNVGNLRELTEVLEFMEQHDIHPQIDARFTLPEAKQALQRLDGAHGFGKVVVAVA